MTEDRYASLSDYLGVLRRHASLIGLLLGISAVTAGVIASRQQPLFRATAGVFVNPTSQLTSGAANSPSDAQERFLATEAQLAHTPEVAGLAVRRGGFNLGADRVLAETSVSADQSSNILTFAVTSPTRSTAVALVNAYVGAFTVRSQRLGALDVDHALSDVSRRIVTINKKIDAAKAAGVVPAALRSQLADLLKSRQRLEQLRLLQPTAATVTRLAQSAPQVQPNLPRAVALGAAFGLILGLVVAFLREALDSRPRSSEQASSWLGVPLLARIPTPSRKLRSADRLAMISGPFDEAEPYRRLRVAFDLANLDARARVVMISSASEQEGKSTTAANLAVAFAKVGRDVVLLDLDLRRPVIHKFFGLPAAPGITDLALGSIEGLGSIAPVMLDVDTGDGDPRPPGRLRVIPAGTVPDSPGDFLESPRLVAAVERLSSDADLVIVDTPPMLPVSDALSIARSSDGVLLVVNGEIVRRPAVNELRRVLGLCHARALGVVATAADAEERDYGASSYYPQPRKGSGSGGMSAQAGWSQPAEQIPEDAESPQLGVGRLP